MADNYAEINGKKIDENLKITTNLKTLLWVASGLFAILMTLFTIFYFDMKDRDAATNLRMDTVLEEVQTEVSETLDKELDKYDEKQDEMQKMLYDMAGDIKVILSHTDNVQPNTPTIVENPQPTTTAPPEQ